MKLSKTELYTTKPETILTASPDLKVEEKRPASFLILGKKDSFTGLYDSMVERHSQLLDSYLSARTRLIRLGEEKRLPSMIILQLPFEEREVKSFIKWLRFSDDFCKIPVVYNGSFLSSEQFVALQELNLVDDILRNTSDYASLGKKASFLGRVKANESSLDPRLSREKIRSGFISGLNRFLKRSLDVIVSLGLIIFLSPVLLLISLAIALESRGPIIYTSRRAGRGFKVFNFYKFRTMVVDADQKVEDLLNLNQYQVEDGAPRFFKIENDPRVTKVGCFLRNTSLDELPQLFNVLKGDMSLVGNRPLPLYEAATLTTDQWAERFMAPAGMTGLWQIKKRGQTGMSVEERINLDIEYARNNTLMKDLWIMANTPKALMQKSNV